MPAAVAVVVEEEEEDSLESVRGWELERKSPSMLKTLILWRWEPLGWVAVAVLVFLMCLFVGWMGVRVR